MKIDKRQCRAFAFPKAGIDGNSGLLLLPKIRYIVRTAVKSIGGHRILVLYVYEKAKLSATTTQPIQTIFQSKDDFATLQQEENGKSHWRKAGFDHLDWDYHYGEVCAFYTRRDKITVERFCKGHKGDGFLSLIHLQYEIQCNRAKIAQCKKEKKILQRMAVVPRLPRTFLPWAHREVVPHFLFYNYTRAKQAQGICTACDKAVLVEGAKHNASGICPHCGKHVTFKANGRTGYVHEQGTAQLLQRTGPNEMVLRIFKLYHTYRRNQAPDLSVYESRRILITWDAAGYCSTASYYHDSGHGILTPWRSGTGQTRLFGLYCFSADPCGQLYTAGLQKALAGSPLQYCAIAQFADSDHEPLEVLPYLNAYVKHPKLELLVKLGLTQIVSDLVYRGGSMDARWNEAQTRPHRLLGVFPEDIAFLQKWNPTVSALRELQHFCAAGIHDGQSLLMWQWKNGIQQPPHALRELRTHMTAYRLTRYLDAQLVLLKPRLTAQKQRRYNGMNDIINEYRDYLDMCKKQGLDLGSNFVLYPKDLQKVHDRMAHQIKLKADAKMRREFKAAYKAITSHLDFEENGLRIVYPEKAEDVVAEGAALHHCVGGYVDRVARRECIILFLRKADQPDKPFYTIEVRHREVQQVRGFKNENATPEVKSFMDAWEKSVLKLPAPRAAA